MHPMAKPLLDSHSGTTGELMGLRERILAVKKESLRKRSR